jgi:hypothetical protein
MLEWRKKVQKTSRFCCNAVVGCGEKVRNKLPNQRASPLFKKLF